MIQAFLKSQRAERIWMLAKVEFRQRYYEHKAGMLWALAKPIADSLIYWVVFKYIMKNNIPNFSLYLFLGFIFSGIFNECASGKISFLAEKKSLYEYSNMNKWEIYISSIIANFIGLLFNLIVFFILAIVIGDNWTLGFSIFALPLLIICSYIICISWAIILSAIYLNVRDISQIWQVVSTILFWSSPVILDDKLFVGGFEFIAYIHPYSSIISFGRDIILYAKVPDTVHILSLLTSMAIYFCIAFIMMKKVVSYASEKL